MTDFSSPDKPRNPARRDSPRWQAGLGSLPLFRLASGVFWTALAIGSWALLLVFAGG